MQSFKLVMVVYTFILISILILCFFPWVTYRIEPMEYPSDYSVSYGWETFGIPLGVLIGLVALTSEKRAILLTLISIFFMFFGLLWLYIASRLAVVLMAMRTESAGPHVVATLFVDVNYPITIATVILIIAYALAGVPLQEKRLSYQKHN
jgi:hypothetical protein